MPSTICQRCPRMRVVRPRRHPMPSSRRFAALRQRRAQHRSNSTWTCRPYRVRDGRRQPPSTTCPRCRVSASRYRPCLISTCQCSRWTLRACRQCKHEEPTCRARCARHAHLGRAMICWISIYRHRAPMLRPVSTTTCPSLHSTLSYQVPQLACPVQRAVRTCHPSSMSCRSLRTPSP